MTDAPELLEDIESLLDAEENEHELELNKKKEEHNKKHEEILSKLLELARNAKKKPAEIIREIKVPNDYDDSSLKHSISDIYWRLTELVGKKHDHTDLIGVTPDQHHPQDHPIDSHDTFATGNQLNQLVSKKNADHLHTHKIKQQVIAGSGITEKYVILTKKKNTYNKTVNFYNTEEDSSVVWYNSAPSYVLNMNLDGTWTVGRDPTEDLEVATKQYVDAQVGGVNEFTELIDTPNSYSGQASKGVRVNVGEDGLEFYTSVTDTDEKASIDSSAVPGYLGAADSDGILRVSNQLTYTDGGDFITIGVDEGAVDHDNLLNYSADEHFTMLDEDDMASDSDTQAATQQSIKAYVGSQIATVDELNDLTDVVITSPTDNELLAYDNGSSRWINQTATEAGLLPGQWTDQGTYLQPNETEDIAVEKDKRIYFDA